MFQDFVDLILYNPATYVVLIIEFALGFAFGYYFRKLIKGMIALMVLGFISTLLNYTLLITLKDAIVEQLGITPEKLVTLIGLITMTFVLTMLAPITIGLLIGFYIGGRPRIS